MVESRDAERQVHATFAPVGMTISRAGDARLVSVRRFAAGRCRADA